MTRAPSRTFPLDQQNRAPEPALTPGSRRSAHQISASEITTRSARKSAEWPRP
jgi:hypothetical protein